MGPSLFPPLAQLRHDPYPTPPVAQTSTAPGSPRHSGGPHSSSLSRAGSGGALGRPRSARPQSGLGASHLSPQQLQHPHLHATILEEEGSEGGAASFFKDDPGSGDERGAGGGDAGAGGARAGGGGEAGGDLGARLHAHQQGQGQGSVGQEGRTPPGRLSPRATSGPPGGRPGSAMPAGFAASLSAHMRPTSASRHSVRAVDPC